MVSDHDKLALDVINFNFIFPYAYYPLDKFLCTIICEQQLFLRISDVILAIILDF